MKKQIINARKIFLERGFIRAISWLFLIAGKKLKYRFNINKNNAESNLPVQIIYVVAEKDLLTLTYSLDSLFYIKGVQIDEIILIGKKGGSIEEFAKTRDLNFIDEESVLGFGPNHYFYPMETGARSGWLYQQMIKLGWSKFSNKTAYIVVDADTIFIDDTYFVLNDKYVFFLAEEFYIPYSKSYEMIFNKKDYSLWSYVAHMMIFDVSAVNEMLDDISANSDSTWHEAIAETRKIDSKSCFSEYHTYATWFKENYSDKWYSCPLYNVSIKRENFNFIELSSKKNHYKTISMHSYL